VLSVADLVFANGLDAAGHMGGRGGDVASGTDAKVAMTIGGLPEWSSATIAVVDPATGEVFAEAPDASEEQVGRAAEAAAEAFPRWAADSDLRADVLRAAAAAVEEAVEDLGRLTTLEQGKPLANAVLEAKALAGFLADSADLRPSEDLYRDDGVAMAKVSRRPLGVVAAIVPWNSALYVAGMKAAPALAAGNTVVVKPSPDAPLAALRLGEVLRDVFPPGVFNVIAGGDSVGPWLVDQPRVRVVSFTGSAVTGSRVAASAGAGLKHLILELGGNDAAIVLDDADPATVADALFANAFGSAGQVCSGIKRVYVHESLHAEIVERLAERALRTRVGSGMSPDTEMGPLTTLRQLEHVSALVEDAVERGGRVRAGGRRLDQPGYFYPPTVVDELDDGSRLVVEEQFGPALPVLSFRHDADAMARANRSEYGLGGSVWTSDFERGLALAEQFETGMSWVNSHKGVDPSLPFGGSKCSGLGVERGIWGLHCFTEIHATSGIRASTP
jgi:acyl-CoA reductase-like NAD-dependent aldehyde dehydrogenase